jgi:hypothetical protein
VYTVPEELQQQVVSGALVDDGNDSGSSSCSRLPDWLQCSCQPQHQPVEQSIGITVTSCLSHSMAALVRSSAV